MDVTIGINLAELVYVISTIHFGEQMRFTNSHTSITILDASYPPDTFRSESKKYIGIVTMASATRMISDSCSILVCLAFGVRIVLFVVDRE